MGAEFTCVREGDEWVVDGASSGPEISLSSETVRPAGGQEALAEGAVVVKWEIPKFRLLLEGSIDNLGPAAR